MAEKRIVVKGSFGSPYVIICSESEYESFMEWVKLYKRGKRIDRDTIFCAKDEDLRACRICAMRRGLETHAIFTK